MDSTGTDPATGAEDGLPDWREFCDSLDFGSLVPEAYERYRPAVVDGLSCFLEHLSLERAEALLEAQLHLPLTASVAERVVAIARLCPALHKLGQVMARDHRLPAELRHLLQTLESMSAAWDIAEARAAVEAELGDLAALGIVIDEPPLAEASVAVVTPFVWKGADGSVRRGVCKLLKPGIEARLSEDLELLQQVGALLDARCAAYALPQIAYEETFAQVRDLLGREVHLEHEQAHLRMAAVAYAGNRKVVIPEVFAFSTPRLTAMQRIDGHKVTEVADLDSRQRHALAKIIVQSLIAHPLWSPELATVFHADPHAGNLLRTDDGRLAILDWSLVGHLSKGDRVCLTLILLGAVTLDGGRVADAIRSLASDLIDDAALNAVVDRQMQHLRDGGLPGLSWLTDLMDAAVTGARGRFGGDLVMFRKVLQTLEGVIRDVSDDIRVDRLLAVAFLRKLLMEWLPRAFSQPFSRAFATHLSNADLTQVMMLAPLIGSRQLLGLQADLLGIDGPRAGADGAAT